MKRHPFRPRTPSRLRRSVSAVLAAVLATSALTALTASPAAATTSTPTVVNPLFNTNGAGTATPTGWSTTGTAAASYTQSATGYDSSYELTHWSASAYDVDTYQTITNITPGNYTLGVWIRSGGGDVSNAIALTGCGLYSNQTSVPVVSDGNWLHVVTSVDATSTSCTINLETDAAAGDWTNYDDVTFTAGYAWLAIRGGDVSSLYRGEQDGGVYYTSSGTEENALQILSNAGMNYVRLRVWVNPEDGFDNEAELLAEAKQAAGYGLPLLLDFHYSDTWTSPGQQAIPAAWASDTFAQLESQVYTYSDEIVAALVAQGTPPSMVQVGNEINAGMLLPDGATADWAQLAGLLKEGIAGVHAADSSAKIALHLAGSDDLATLETWFTTAINDGVSFDDIGISYYDYWDGRLDVLQTDLDGLAAKYGKPVFVAETAYPWTLSTADAGTSESVNSSTALDPGYPATPAGQAANFQDVLSVVQAVPNGLGLGAFYWEPTWTSVAGNGWDPTNSSSGDGWENQAMFDFSDTALPIISDFASR